LIHFAEGMEVGVDDPDEDDGYEVHVLYMPGDLYARPSPVSMA
jgi:hypothetical protein